MLERIRKSFNVLYRFIRDPFATPLDDSDDDVSLVVIASILSAFVVIVEVFNQQPSPHEPMMDFVRAFLGILFWLPLTPLFGLLIVHLKGGIFYLYLKYIASQCVRSDIDNAFKAKEIVTFSSIGIVVSAVPSLWLVGICVQIVLEFVGIHRLFNVRLPAALAIVVIHCLLWEGIALLIAAEAPWI